MASPPACGLRGTSSITRCGGRRTCSLESTKAESPGRTSIRPMAVTEKKYHVGLGPGDVGEYVLQPGDPFRTPVIAKYLAGARDVAFSPENPTFTGKPAGLPVSPMSNSMGGA